jgi:para-aminobenzoate synthetase/4-amino-4-deoxychorismate lyase
VFARIDGRWYTPPVADGALPGVMRGVLIEDSIWDATERSLSLEDLQAAQKLVVCNALRGVLPAQLQLLQVPPRLRPPVQPQARLASAA